MPEGFRFNPQHINPNAQLPYGLKVEEIEKAVSETYRLFYGLNRYLEQAGFRRMDQLLLGNSLSGVISEFLVKNIANTSESLIANTKVGGHPDLLPRSCSGSNSVLRGSEGIEVKASIQKGGWQGHNPEDCWLMVFRYEIEDTVPLTFVEILCARLLKSDWSFSGRNGESRRTPTASITSTGMEKLRDNFIYRLPGAGVGKHRN